MDQERGRPDIYHELSNLLKNYQPQLPFPVTTTTTTELKYKYYPFHSGLQD